MTTYFKELRWHCQNYIEFIRGLPCLLCNTPGPSDPHHERSAQVGGDGGTALKPSDVYLVPLCHKHHVWRDSKQFWEDGNTDVYFDKCRLSMLRTLNQFLSRSRVLGGKY